MNSDQTQSAKPGRKHFPKVGKSLASPPPKDRVRSGLQLTLQLYLFVLIIAAIAGLFIGWPGGAWTVQRYGADNRMHALREISQQTSDCLVTGLRLLGSLEGSPESILTGSERDKVNTALALAWQLNRRMSGNASYALLGSAVPVSNNLEAMKKELVTAMDRLRERVSRVDTQKPMRGCRSCTPDCVTCGEQAGVVPSEWKDYHDKLAAMRKAFPEALGGSMDLHYTIVVCLFGLIGAGVRGIHSIGMFVGMQSFRPRWGLYYLALPWVGAGLALTFYAIFRGGLIDMSVKIDDVANINAFAAIALVVGLCTRQAMDKIRDIANQLFSGPQEADKDKLEQARADVRRPTIADVQIASDGRSGVVLGQRLFHTKSIFIGRREMIVKESTNESAFFDVPPMQGALTQQDLFDIVVITDSGASDLYDDRAEPAAANAGGA